MVNAILVINAGSSSIKFSLFADQAAEPELKLRGQVEGLYTKPHFVARNAAGATLSEHEWTDSTRLGHDGAIEHLAGFLKGYDDQFRLTAVGHRVVHGGMEFSAPVLVNPSIVKRLEQYVALAPLHQPHNLSPIRFIAGKSPDLPQVACFDTAFHRQQPEVAQSFALPASITDRGVRRYGFHGLSYEYIASVLSGLEGRTDRVIVAHLGNGASMCAMRAGHSIASTMGFTALDGLPMGTRCGTIDPGVILYLMDEMGMDARAIEKLIYQQSGLLGVSGISSDMRTLLASKEPRAKFAVDLFIYRIGRELGSLAAALGGLDALVFTGGIGERAALIRQRVCEDAGWLGIALDPAANKADASRISIQTSRASAWVIPTNEELMIARHTRRLITEK